MATRYQTRITGGRTNISRNAKLHNIFQQHEHDIAPWLRNKNMGDCSISDGLMKYFQGLGAVGENLSDLVDNRLNAIGYGAYENLNDKLNAFFESKFPRGNRGDSEGAFWDSPTSTFT